MKTNEIEKMLLLNQSGELSARARERLESLLAADPAARMQAEEQETLRNAWRQATADTPLSSPSVLQRIRQAASNQGHKRKTARLIRFRLPAVGIAAAAAAMIALGASLYLPLRSPGDTPSARMAEMDPVDLQIEAALEVIDNSMLALLEISPDEVDPPSGNES